MSRPAPIPRRAVVWGVGSAVGAAYADLLARTGALVLAVDRDPAAATALARRSGEVVPHVAVLDDEAAAASAASAAAELWGGVDVLVDCTAGMELWPPEEDTAGRFTEVLAANVVAPWAHVEGLADALAAGSAPAVVLLGSIDGLRANPHLPAYSAGKAGTAALTRALAARLGPRGIRVNGVAAAGVVQTPEALGPPRRTVGDPDLARRLTPLGRMPTASEIAEVIAFLASEASSAVSGVVVPVDGGRLAATPGTWVGPDEA